MSKLKMIVYSDYLCPWCHNASHRLGQIAREFGDEVELEWRSYLLRPEPRQRPADDAALEKFRRYTQSWLRPAAEEDSAEFRTWQTDLGPPSHSVPAHVVAKAAARLGPEAFEALHDRLLQAYFVENRDISDGQTLHSLWGELGLDPQAFPDVEDPGLVEEVLDEYKAAIELGVTGVPAVQMAGDDVVITGAHPQELYRRWVTRRLGAAED